MKEIKAEIEISSTPDKVWEVLMDLPGWAEWNPIVNKIEGKLEVGEKLNIVMCGSNGKDSKRYAANITVIDENKCFRFIAVMMGKFMFSADRIIELEKTANGTLFIQREIYSGIMVSLFWAKLSTEALSMLKSMNEALKKEVKKVV